MAARWDDLKAVMHLVRAGSLAGAGDALKVNYTTVARRISRAEKALGAVLFERLADGYRPTRAGHTVAREAAKMEGSEFDLLRLLGRQQESLEGRLVVTAPQLMCATCLAPILSDFTDRHPEVALEVRASTDLLDLNRREADLAIRISNDPGDSLTGLRLAEQATASFASRQWAERIAADPETPIDWVVYSNPGTVPRAAREGSAPSRVRLACDDMVAMVGAVQAGIGVARMPMFVGRGFDDLVQVPILPPQPYLDIWLVAHRDVWPSARVRAFRDCLVPAFKADAAHFVG